MLSPPFFIYYATHFFYSLTPLGPIFHYTESTTDLILELETPKQKETISRETVPVVYLNIINIKIKVKTQEKIEIKKVKATGLGCLRNQKCSITFPNVKRRPDMTRNLYSYRVYHSASFHLIQTLSLGLATTCKRTTCCDRRSVVSRRFLYTDHSSDCHVSF